MTTAEALGWLVKIISAPALVLLGLYLATPALGTAAIGILCMIFGVATQMDNGRRLDARELQGQNQKTGT